MVAGAVSRQIEAGLLVTGVDGTRRFAEVSPESEQFLREHRNAEAVTSIDRWLADVLPDEDELPT